ncbi:PLC-like phosphodiesterase [Melampsora americana]|nr:PLC-like phosphodiesterase [Melampsora americana]
MTLSSSNHTTEHPHRPNPSTSISSSWPSHQKNNKLHISLNEPRTLLHLPDQQHVSGSTMIRSCIKNMIYLLVTVAYIGVTFYSSGAIGLQTSQTQFSQRPHGLIFSGDEVAIGIEVEVGVDHSTQNQSERQILAASPILGFYNQSNGPLADWMADVPDNTSLIDMNIPGTHDSATWNYTEETQSSMTNITGQLPPAIAYQCQDRSLFQMLGDGIRFLDLRIGFLPGSQELGFFHASALQSSTATLPDVLLGFYRWLDDHPTETVLISMKVDNATFADPPSHAQPSSPKLQSMVHELLTNELGSRYWLQKNGTLGTLGEARGKLVFLQRIQMDTPMLGIALPPSQFNDNDPAFALVYNERTGATAYIEDFYNILPNPSTFEDKVAWKLEITVENLIRASGPKHSDQLFISFASGGALRNTPPVTPQMLAVGANNTAGVNSGLIEYFSHYRGKRFGVVILDWYASSPDLVKSIIDRSY